MRPHLALRHGTAMVLLGALATTGLAVAQDRPPITPTRDVSVLYRVEGSGQSGEMRFSWLNAERILRMDLPGGLGWSITDLRDGRGRLVMEEQKVVMELPKQSFDLGAGPMQPSPTARFAKGGTETILGQRCTVWRMEDGPNKGESCITADGVMLRGQGATGGAGRGSFTAIAIDVAPQDPVRFRVPAGYRTMVMPGGPGGGDPRPPSR